MAWTAALRWASQVVSWSATFYAARILAPGDYGLVTMAMLVIGLARMVQEFGLDAILVQDRSIVGSARARLAGMLVAIGITLFLAYAACAPLVAGFFSEPRVADIVTVLGLLFILDSIQVVPYAQLQRELKFRRLAILMFIQVVVTAVALALAATYGLGAWALVVNQLTGEVVVTIILLSWSPYAIAWPRQIAELARPLKQGLRMLMARIAWYAYTNADQTIIGRVLGKELLGAYTLALSLSTIAQSEIGSILGRVVPGVFSEIQNKPGEIRRYFLLLTEALTIVAFPVAIGLAMIADLAVPILLGEQWRNVVAPLRWLCMYSAFLSAQTLISHVLLWTGQFRVNMWCSILAGVTIPVALLFAVRQGLEGVGMAWALVFPLASLPAFYFAFRTIAIKIRDWLWAIWPALAACAAMSIAVFLVRLFLSTVVPPFALMVISIGTGAIAYIAMLILAFRERIRLLAELAKSLRPAPRSA